MKARAMICAAGSLAACALTPPASVELIVEGVVAAEVAGPSGAPAQHFFNRVAQDPQSADLDQDYALYGREDLVSGDHASEYKANSCEPLGGDVLSTIEAAARGAQIVIVNESHVRTRTAPPSSTSRSA